MFYLGATTLYWVHGIHHPHTAPEHSEGQGFSCHQGPKSSPRRHFQSHVFKTQRCPGLQQMGIWVFTQGIPNCVGGLYGAFTAAHCLLSAIPSMAAATHPSRRPLSFSSRPPRNPFKEAIIAAAKSKWKCLIPDAEWQHREQALTISGE